MHPSLQLLLLSLILCIRSQAQPLQPREQDSLVYARVAATFRPLTEQPAEKLYLHTDKPCYFAGDTIWLESYLVNAVSHFPNAQSRYVYVELIDRKDQVVQRRKIERNQSQTFSGCFPLPGQLTEGDYYIRAYTRWMLNGEPDYFFHKNIKVYASQASLCETAISYHSEGQKRLATITFKRTGGEPYRGRYVRYMVRTKPTGNAFRRQQTNDQGEITVSLPPKEELEQYVYTILEEGQLQLKHTFYVPPVFDYQVDFFPEGGDLIDGSTQKVAFKAQQSDGTSLPVSGWVVSAAGDTVVHFSTLHDGMGSFLLSPSATDRYTAHTVSGLPGQELEKEFPLPRAATDRYALSVVQRKQMAHYRVLHGDRPFSASRFYLLGHIRGHVLFVSRLEQDRGAIDLSALPDGILSLLLLDDSLLPYSERLLFVRNQQVSCQITPDRTSYAPRSPVTLDLSFRDLRGKPMQGVFSVSVTDNYAVGIDSTANNILSHLLLRSDLKGTIASPGYYFTSHSPRLQTCLDHVMLTHGWSRFRLEDILKGERPSIRYAVETSQTIAGSVRSIGGKPVEGRPVVVQVKDKSCPPLLTDAEGRFSLRQSQLRDSVLVSARVIENGKLLRSTIQLERDTFPPALHPDPFGERRPSEYVAQVQSPYVEEDGMWVLNLPEVVVRANVLVKERFSHYKVDDEEIVRQMDARTALDLVWKVPGFQIIDHRPYLNPNRSIRPELRMSNDLDNRNVLRPVNRISYGPTVRFMLDQHPISYSLLSEIKAEDIATVYSIEPDVDSALDYMNNRQALEEAYNEALENGASLEELDELEFSHQINRMRDGAVRTSGGCIVLTSRMGNLRPPTSDSRTDQIYLLGLSRHQTFYVPRYASPQVDASHPDRRTTLHWQTSLRPDAEGHARVHFYTADRPTSYTVVVEGITPDGLPCHSEYLLF